MEISVANVEKIYKELSWKPENNNLSTILVSALNWEKKIITKELELNK